MTERNGTPTDSETPPRFVSSAHGVLVVVRVESDEPFSRKDLEYVLSSASDTLRISLAGRLNRGIDPDAICDAPTPEELAAVR